MVRLKTARSPTRNRTCSIEKFCSGSLLVLALNTCRLHKGTARRKRRAVGAPTKTSPSHGLVAGLKAHWPHRLFATGVGRVADKFMLSNYSRNPRLFSHFRVTSRQIWDSTRVNEPHMTSHQQNREGQTTGEETHEHFKY